MAFPGTGPYPHSSPDPNTARRQRLHDRRDRDRLHAMSVDCWKNLVSNVPVDGSGALIDEDLSFKDRRDLLECFYVHGGGDKCGNQLTLHQYAILGLLY
jgi:hypothetical protein